MSADIFFFYAGLLYDGVSVETIIAPAKRATQCVYKKIVAIIYRRKLRTIMQSDTTGFLQEFHKILEEAGKKGASDIHYVPKEQLLLRIDGRLVDMTEEWNVSFSMEELIEELLDKKQQKTFEENGEVEFSCPVFNRRVRRESVPAEWNVRNVCPSVCREDPDTADAWSSGVGSADGWEEKRAHSCDRCIRQWKDNNDGVDDRPYCF